jgi:hypothetical protein
MSFLRCPEFACFVIRHSCFVIGLLPTERTAGARVALFSCVAIRSLAFQHKRRRCAGKRAAGDYDIVFEFIVPKQWTC